MQCELFSPSETKPVENNTVIGNAEEPQLGEREKENDEYEILASEVVKTAEKIRNLTSLTAEIYRLNEKITALTKETSKLKNQTALWQKKCFRRQKTITKLKQQMYELRTRTTTGKECETDCFNSQLIERILRKKHRHKLSRKYEVGVRKFAVTTHFYSPSAYKYLRSQLGNILPHVKTLARWYSTIDGAPGFTKEALNMLSLKAKICAEMTPPKKILCSLVFDEMAIKQQKEYDGSSYHGYVDVGAEIDYSDKEEAKEALVFMVVAVNDSWKVPVGYFFINGLSSEQKAALVSQCLTLLKECGIVISNVTFDGCPANLSMSTKLGCILDVDNMKTSFGDENVNVFPDPSHMLKLIRNTFGDKKKFIDVSDEIIDFKYVESLNMLQENEGLHLANKLRGEHIRFFKQKMKVKLASQLLSRSVAEALLFCKDVLKLKEFEGCEATVRFILIINDAFDILNSRNLSEYGYKKPLCEKNIVEVEEFVKKFQYYIKGLLLLDLQPVLISKRKTGFLGIAMALNSMLQIYNNFIKKEHILKFLPAYKCSQDHLEIFFGVMRLQCGCNDNPTCRLFRSSYKKLLVHNEVRDNGLGNCISLEQLQILNCSSSKKTSEIIVDSETLINYDDIINNENPFINDHSQLQLFLTDYALSNFSEEVVKYIAGFVARKLSSSLKCAQCVSCLLGIKENLLGSFIDFTNRGGLTYPSNEVITICIIAEKMFRHNQNDGERVNKLKLICELQKEYFFKWRNKTAVHAVHLSSFVKTVGNVYLNLRIKYACKSKLKRDTSNRNIFKKLILFKGQ